MKNTQFDLTAYRASKKRVIELIKQTHDWQNTEGFLADGVICPDIYAQQSTRILCVLAESYGYDECKDDYDMEEQPKKDVMGLSQASVKTPRKLATLLHLILRSLETGAIVSRDEWREMPEFFSVRYGCLATLQAALFKIAWINVKKASREEGTSLDYVEVLNHADRNKAVLEEQLKHIAPHLVLVCGSATFQSVLNLGLLGGGIQPGKTWEVQRSESGVLLAEISHPASRGDWLSYESLYQNYAHLMPALFSHLDSIRDD